jgi:CHAT domain-containing protein
MDEYIDQNRGVYNIISCHFQKLIAVRCIDFIENEIKPIDHHFSLSQKIEAISFHQIKNLLNEDTALIEWYLTSEYLRIFIITYQCEYPIVEQTPVWNCLPPKTITDCALMAELGHFLTEYEQDKTLWQTKLSEYFQNFAKIINLDKIFNLLPENCKQLILIPHRFLHWLPIHALPLVDGKCLLDKFDSVRYAPSCQLLEQVQQQQRPNLSDFFAIQNPENNLSYADLEVGVIRSFFATDKVLEKQAATKVALTDNQDLSLAHCSHFSCHGTFKSESPLESALKLANGEQLTLVDIFGLTLNQCRLVTLSACETGLTDPTSISDEYVGLPSGFLYAGSTNVVSSLWKVNDISSTFLMIKFYQNLKENQSRVAKTLNDAQRWLRDATQQQLLDWINQLKLDEDKMKQIKEKLDWYNSDEKPFNSPYHWATFCSIGQ